MSKVDAGNPSPKSPRVDTSLKPRTLPLAVIAHQHQHGVVQIAGLLKPFQPLDQIVFRDRHFVRVVVRQFAVEREHELRLVFVHAKHVFHVIEHYLKQRKTKNVRVRVRAGRSAYMT